MKTAIRICLLLLLAHPAIPATPATPATAPAKTLRFGHFGDVAIYRQSEHPSHVVLFVSGDGGWNLGVVDMARSLASLDALVVGVDIVHYLREIEAEREACVYPAADFEELSQFVQKALGYPSYVPPVLVGYSSGATLVYALLVEAPAGTFRGAMSLGFCPDLPLTKPFCKGSGLTWGPGPKGKGVSFLPCAKLPAPWIAFQGEVDQVCSPAATRKFVSECGGARVVSLPGVGHGFSVQKNWMPQFRDAFRSLLVTPGPAGDPPKASRPAGDVSDLPLRELPGPSPDGPLFAVLLTGDGGWAGLDRDVAGAISADGIPVVGWDSLQYYWKARTPDGAAEDLARILRHYLAAWKKESVVLAGYSRGADVLPFLVRRLPDDLRARVRVIALLGLEEDIEFEFHVVQWLGGSGAPTHPVRPELEPLRGMRILCFVGSDEKQSLCSSLDEGLARRIELEGGHHFGGHYDVIAKDILMEARKP